MSLKEVAKLAGVSVTTASRVVNGGQISVASNETRKKIWAAVREVGYIPNLDAQKLRKGKKDNKDFTQIDCICPKNAFTDPFFVALLKILENEAARHGFVIKLEYSIADLKKIEHTPNQPRSVIILGRCDEKLIQDLKKLYTYMILITLRDMDFPIDQIVCRGYVAAKQALEYLQSKGHKNICYIGETISEPRYNSFIDNVGENGHAESCFYTAEDGYKAAAKVLDSNKRITAILCSNDIFYKGVLRACKERKLKVPKDISIIGINDMEHTRYEKPMMTAIQIPIEEMGKMALDMISSHADSGWRRMPVTITFKSTLVERDSCAELK